MTRIRLGSLLVAAATVVPLLLATAPAAAAGREVTDRAAKERAARKACLKGNYEQGVDILADLFVDTREPTYIFNQGRCFEQNRRYEDAISRFEEYLRVPNAKLSPEDKASAEKHIADCKEKLPRERVDSPTQPPPLPTPPPVPTTPSAPETSPQTEPSPAAVVTQPVPQPAQRRWGLLTAGIVTATVGVGGVVTGLVSNLKANSMVNDWETKAGSYSTKNENDQRTYKTLAWVGYGVGAACVATGAVLIGVGARSRARSLDAIALVPAVGPGQMGAVLTGAF